MASKYAVLIPLGIIGLATAFLLQRKPSDYHRATEYKAEYDLNEDGVVDIYDLAVATAKWKAGEMTAAQVGLVSNWIQYH
jgi:hypothetical protein